MSNNKIVFLLPSGRSFAGTPGGGPYAVTCSPVLHTKIYRSAKEIVLDKLVYRE